MNLKSSLTFSKLSTYLGCLGLLASQSATAATLFDFNSSNDALNGTAEGGFMEAVDDTTADTVRITTTDILGWVDGEFNVVSILDSSDPNHLLVINEGNSLNALGIGSEGDPLGFGNRTRDFNPREAWTFTFDHAVELTELEFESWSANGDSTQESGFLVSSSAFSDVEILHADLGAGDRFSFDAGVTIPAGTEMTIAMFTNGSITTGEDNVRIESFTVDVLPIPEPSTILMGLLGLPFFLRRKRA